MKRNMVYMVTIFVIATTAMMQFKIMQTISGAEAFNQFFHGCTALLSHYILTKITD